MQQRLRWDGADRGGAFNCDACVQGTKAVAEQLCGQPLTAGLTCNVMRVSKCTVTACSLSSSLRTHLTHLFPTCPPKNPMKPQARVQCHCLLPLTPAALTLAHFFPFCLSKPPSPRRPSSLQTWMPWVCGGLMCSHVWWSTCLKSSPTCRWGAVSFFEEGLGEGGGGGFGVWGTRFQGVAGVLRGVPGL